MECSLYGPVLYGQLKLADRHTTGNLVPVDETGNWHSCLAVLQVSVLATAQPQDLEQQNAVFSKPVKDALKFAM
ncbi:hypothetical protein D3C81_264520 [compost metagenome]